MMQGKNPAITVVCVVSILCKKKNQTPMFSMLHVICVLYLFKDLHSKYGPFMRLYWILQSVSLPDVHFSTGSSWEHQIRALAICHTHHRLCLSSTTECSPLWCETTTRLCPELDVFHACRHEKVRVLWIPFYNKYLVFVTPTMKGKEKSTSGQWSITPELILVFVAPSDLK